MERRYEALGSALRVEVPGHCLPSITRRQCVEEDQAAPGMREAEAVERDGWEHQ